MSLQNKLLVGLVALQAVILVVIFWPSSSSIGVEKLLPGLEEVQVTGVAITDSTGKSIQLTGGPTGCVLVLTQADDYPCEKGKLTSLVDGLVNLNKASLVTQTAGSHRRLKVAGDEYERLVEIQSVDGAPLRIYLGTSPRNGAVHARVENRDEVYLTSAFSTANASVSETAWVDPVYFTVPREQVTGLTQENAQGRLWMEKDQSGEWTLQEEIPDRPVEQIKARSLVRWASSIRMIKPLGKELLDSYGLENPAAVVTVRTLRDDGSLGESVLRIGAKDAHDQGYVMKSSESDYYVLIADTTVSIFVDRGSSNLLEPPPPVPPEPSA